MPKLRILNPLLISALALLVATAPAHAQSYEVTACDAADGENRSWVFETNASSSVESVDSCPSAGWGYTGLQARTILHGAAPAGGVFGQWLFQAPAGTTITWVTLSRWLGMEGGTGWRPYGRTATGAMTGETCTVAAGQDKCNVGPGSVDRAVDTTSIAYGIECNRAPAATCTTGATIHDARAAIYSATVTITDPVHPTVDLPTGPLVTASGYHRGTESASFNGDDDLGLKLMRVYVDGAVVASLASGQAGWPACSYTRVVPCQVPTSDRTLAVNTAALNDGTHQVMVAVVDAADNEQRGAPVTIVVDNSAPAAPQQLATSAGTEWQPAPTFDATWANPGGQVAPIATAHWTLCPRDGASSCAEGQVPAGIGQISGLLIPREGAWELRLQLEDEAGNVAATAGSASTTVRYDAAAPAAPHDLAIAPRAMNDPAAIAGWSAPSDAGAPLTAASWTLCPADGPAGCTSGSAAAAGPLDLHLPAEGTWTLSVSLRDQAGRTGAAATTTIAYARPAVIPTPTAAPPTPTAATPTLTIRAATLDRSRRRLTVRGTVTDLPAGRVNVTARYRIGAHRRTRRATRAIHDGRFGASFRLTRRHAARARHPVVTVRFLGAPGFEPATARRSATSKP